MMPEFYNSLGAMHGTIMIFLGVVPLAVGAFGNYLVPLMVGAPDMAFPKLNAASYWFYFVGGVIMFASFWAPGGGGQLRLDLLYPLVRTCHHGTNLLVGGNDHADHFVSIGFHEYHCHDYSIAGPGTELL